MSKEITLPRLSMSMEGATVVEWFVEENQHFESGDKLYSIETDKIVTEIEATESGVLTKQTVGEDEDANVGDIIGEYTPDN